MLAKAIMVATDVSGSPSTWEARLAARKKKFSAITLGMLVKEMESAWLARSDLPPEDDSTDEPDNPTEIWMRTRIRHSMDPAEYERTVSPMTSLVAMRNDLV
ncbi:MAG: hypothetical protein EOP02_24580, partial [Proteobacteria bacterium]